MEYETIRLCNHMAVMESYFQRCICESHSSRQRHQATKPSTFCSDQKGR